MSIYTWKKIASQPVAMWEDTSARFSIYKGISDYTLVDRNLAHCVVATTSTLVRAKEKAEEIRNAECRAEREAAKKPCPRCGAMLNDLSLPHGTIDGGACVAKVIDEVQHADMRGATFVGTIDMAEMARMVRALGTYMADGVAQDIRVDILPFVAEGGERRMQIRIGGGMSAASFAVTDSVVYVKGA